MVKHQSPESEIGRKNEKVREGEMDREGKRNREGTKCGWYMEWRAGNRFFV
jgi:hypothetical protein